MEVVGGIIATEVTSPWRAGFSDLVDVIAVRSTRSTVIEEMWAKVEGYLQ